MASPRIHAQTSGSIKYNIAFIVVVPQLFPSDHYTLHQSKCFGLLLTIGNQLIIRNTEITHQAGDIWALWCGEYVKAMVSKCVSHPTIYSLQSLYKQQLLIQNHPQSLNLQTIKQQQRRTLNWCLQNHCCGIAGTVSVGQGWPLGSQTDLGDLWNESHLAGIVEVSYPQD